MTIPRTQPTSPESVPQLFRWLAPYHSKANARLAEWINHGQGDENYMIRTIFEVLMDFEHRLAAIESILKPE